MVSVDLKKLQKLYMENVLRDMPKVYFVFDEQRGQYRVGRTDWPNDAFNIVSMKDFHSFLKVMEELNFEVIDKTDED